MNGRKIHGRFVRRLGLESLEPRLCPSAPVHRPLALHGAHAEIGTGVQVRGALAGGFVFAQDHGPARDRAGPPVGPPSGGAPFAAVNDTGWTPPDDNIAVGGQDRVAGSQTFGQSTVVVAVNDQIALFDKSGKPYNKPSNLRQGNNIALTTADSTRHAAPIFRSRQSAFDPRVVYDPANGGHFLLIAVEESDRLRLSKLDIAVSKTANPRTGADWWTYRFGVRQEVHGHRTWMDFPGLGMDATALYVTGNLFTFAGSSFKGVKLVTFDKNAMEHGLPVAGPANTRIFSSHSYTMQPAVTYDSNVPEYLIQARTTHHARTVRLDAIQDPLGTLTDTRIRIRVPEYNTNLTNAPQRGSRRRVDTNDSGMLNAVFRGGALWAADTVEKSRKTVARWYEIDPATASLVASGTINPGRDSRGRPIYTFFPSIAVDGSGNVAVSYAESSAGIDPSAAFATWTTSSRGPSQLGLQNIQKGRAPYLGGRWGDYSGVAPDPDTPGRFWAIGEATLRSGSWGTWWVNTAR
jgi:hypothetical protein